MVTVGRGVAPTNGQSYGVQSVVPHLALRVSVFRGRARRIERSCSARPDPMRSLIMMRVISLLIFSLFVPVASADDPLPKIAEKFEIKGHKAYLYAAPKTAKGKPWVWYAPTLQGL